MPTKIEKDSLTGIETTGHEWDGIRELNNPLPLWWLYVFYACIAASVIMFILMPAIPGISGYTKGVWNYSTRAELHQAVVEAKEAQGENLQRLAATDPRDILSDADLLTFSLAGGTAAFGDNCAPCHGMGGAGRPGFPVLADDAWIWGGDLDAIQTTVRYGIRNGGDEARISEMPAFGEILEVEQIEAVTEYVLSLSDSAENATLAAAGQEVYLENCAACHGEAGEGIREMGAPRLSDAIWLFGGSRAEVLNQIRQPQQGVMPGFEDRLDEATIKMLSVYVHSLGGGEE